MILCWPLINGLPSDKGSKATEAEIKNILTNYDHDASLLCNENSKANWDVQTDTNNAKLKEVQVNINNKYFYLFLFQILTHLNNEIKNKL